MALVRQVGFTRFSRWGENLGRLHVSAATHTEALDGTDEVKLTCAEDLVKGDRVVWADRLGRVHEHIADTVTRTHSEDGATETQATCINSVAELWDDYIEDKRPSGSAAAALASILADTRWEAGACDVGTTASKTFYHVSVREALGDLLSTWGGELETEVETDGATVTARRVRIRALRGDQDSPKRFTWTKDLLSVAREVGSDNPKTRVYGYGKGVETDGGGYGRRLTFGEVNGGLDYVEDEAATQVWGHPDGKGGVLPAVDVFIDEECEDAATLLQETRDYLETVKAPTVSYTAGVLDLQAFGRDWEGVGLGDTVAVIDRGFGDEGVRLRGRVSKLKRDLVTADTEVTFGNLTDAMADMWASVAQALKSSSNARAGYDAVAGTSVGWLTQLQAALNKQFNAVGTYKVESFELGSVYSNVPLNADTGTPVKTVAGMWAVNINGMGMRLASSLNAQGEWDWKTFITGASVTADCINAGTMRADRIRAGLLTDEAGKNYWDLTSGEFSLSAGATVGGESIATSDAAIKAVDVEYAQGESATDAPTEGWQTTAPTWQAGKYIWQRTKTVMQSGAAGYSEAVCISGRDGVDGKDGTDGAPGEAGADGKDGATGKGVSAIQEQYYLSTSSTTQAGGAWYASQPAWVKGRYYWTRSKVTWSDGTVTYTTPQLARALTSSNQGVSDLDTKLTQQEIFNRLTNNGQTQGIYLQDGKVYVNGTYIKAGAIDGGLIKAGTIVTSSIQSDAKDSDEKPAAWIFINGGMVTSNGVARYLGQLTMYTATSDSYIFRVETQVDKTYVIASPVNYDDTGETGVAGISLHAREPGYRYYVTIMPKTDGSGHINLVAQLFGGEKNMHTYQEKVLCTFNEPATE